MHARARAAALGILEEHPRSHLTIPGYASTLADIAAHMVATAAVRRHIVNVDRAVARHIDAGRLAIALLSMETSDPDPSVSRTPYSNTVEGVVGTKWQYSLGQINHYGATSRLSGSLRGLFERLPALEPDHDELTRRYRGELIMASVPADIAEAAVVQRGSSPHRFDDSRPWTEFLVPMPDRRLDHRGHVVDLMHQSTIQTSNSMAQYARQAAKVHENLDTIGRMADAAEEIAFEQTIDVPELDCKGVRLYSVHIHRGLKMKDNVVLHIDLEGLSEAFRRIPVLGVMTGPIGSTCPETTNLPEMVKIQQKRARAFKRLGHPTIDRTGRLFMEAAEHVPDDLLKGLKDGLTNIETRLHAGHGTKAWFRIDNGRITAAVDISPEVRWKNDRLEIKRHLPETVVGSLPGRPGTVIMEHPALENTVIRSARMEKGRLVVGIAPIWEKMDEPAEDS